MLNEEDLFLSLKGVTMPTQKNEAVRFIFTPLQFIALNLVLTFAGFVYLTTRESSPPQSVHVLTVYNSKNEKIGSGSVMPASGNVRIVMEIDFMPDDGTFIIRPTE